MNKESIKTYKEDGGKLCLKFHSFFGFYVAIPPGLTPEEEEQWTVQPLF